MLALVMHEFGDERVLQLEEVEDPQPGAGEVIVQVGAVEVSSTRDIATRTGRHPFSRQVSLPHVLGGDFAGVVTEVGSGVDPRLVGQRVAAANSRSCGSCAACTAGREAQCPELSMLGIHRWGSYAERTAVPVANLDGIPDDITLSEAAAMSATGPIAFTQLQIGCVSPGTWVLITGATGALATMLIVLAGHLGARVIGLSRRPDQVPAALALSACLESGDETLAERLMECTAGAGIATAIDNVAAGAVFTRYFPALAVGGRVVVSGAIGAAEAPVLPVPAGPFYLRSLSLLGVRTATGEQRRAFWRLVAGGLRLPNGLLHERPLAEAASAHAEITTGAAVGHTVLTVSP